MPISGVLARATEALATDLGLDGMVPARFTLDLFSPALQMPTMTTASVVRRGRRLCLIDASFMQQGRAVARSSTLFLTASEAPAGAVWSAGISPAPPPRDLRPDSDEQRLYFTETTGWSQSPSAEPSAERKQSWHFPIPIVEDELLTPFQMATSVADSGNVVSNWGSAGLQFINADVTLALTRQPIEMEFGLSALDRVEADGISVGSAVMFDRAGVFGTTTIVGLANALRSVDPRTRKRIPQPANKTRD
ncbi:acyl-CoA thioesterase domain-containing protein [Paenarthrobacter aurescens]|uniref:acyl-CoA thioesterase domain-containing protein n=1 Tax=Paenarthrobacter aurescens TaxID=43663 RepID=UPI0035ED1B72